MAPQSQLECDGLSQAERRGAVARILATEAFRRAPQLTRLFRFVADAAIDNEQVTLNEYEIGVGALGRPKSYSPNEDNIVRVLARTLRQKLEKYYEGPGAADPVRVSIARGTYIPRFAAAEEMTAAPALQTVVVKNPAAPLPQMQPALQPPQANWRKFGKLFWCLAIAGMAMLAYVILPKSSPVERFWTGFLHRGQSVTFVPTDASLVVMQELTRTELPLARYAGRDYWHDFNTASPGVRDLAAQLGSRRLTSLTSMKAAMLLTARAERQGAKIIQQYARDARADSIDHEQLFIVGAAHSNPWVDMFSEQNRFVLNRKFSTGSFSVQIRDPRPGEPATIDIPPSSGRVYGLISFRANKSSGKQVLIVQGTGSAGTEAALDFLFNDERMNEFLTGLGPRFAQTSQFELLLESLSVAGTAPSARVIARRGE